MDSRYQYADGVLYFCRQPIGTYATKQEADEAAREHEQERKYA